MKTVLNVVGFAAFAAMAAVFAICLALGEAWTASARDAALSALGLQ